MGKQGQLQGFEGVRIKEIEEAIDVYKTVMSKRVRYLDKEKSAKAELIRLMISHEMRVYRDESHSPPVIVQLNSVDKLKLIEAETGHSETDEADDE